MIKRCCLDVVLSFCSCDQWERLWLWDYVVGLWHGMMFSLQKLAWKMDRCIFMLVDFGIALKGSDRWEKNNFYGWKLMKFKLCPFHAGSEHGTNLSRISNNSVTFQLIWCPHWGHQFIVPHPFEPTKRKNGWQAASKTIPILSLLIV